MPKKSILYIITKSVWGGAGKYVYDLSTNITDDFNVAVAAGGRNILAQKLQEKNIPYYEIKNFQRDINFIKEPLAFFEILSLLFKIKPDIIHTNSSKAGGTVGLAAFIYKIITFRKLKVIFTAHGWVFNEDLPKTKIFLIKQLSRLTAFFSDTVICVSEYDRQKAIENDIPARKLITIHNGIEAPDFLDKKTAQRKLMGKIADKTTIGTIAEWHYNKGLTYLLEAVKNLPVNLILIGGGESKEENKLREYIQKNNLKNVYLHKNLPQAANYLKAFDLFVLPSIKEGFPYTILEAIAAGIPVIATNVGGIPEILNEDSLVEPKNSRQLAEKIQHFSEIKITENNFGLDQMIQKTICIYRPGRPE